MPLTLSGRRVNRETNEHPSLTDIAVGLSRMPRFAGQTHRWFSVLDHTMFGLRIIEQSPLRWQYDIRWWLLHDAHEAMTGDVPTDLKDAGLRYLQETLDRRIFGAFYPQWFIDPQPTKSEARIDDIDNRCLRAEAKVLKDAIIGGAPHQDDVNILWDGLRDGLGKPPLEQDQHTHPLVRAYVAKMVELM